VPWDHPETGGRDISAAHRDDYISDLEGTTRAIGDDAGYRPIVPWVERMRESRIDRIPARVDTPSPSFSHSPYSHPLRLFVVAVATQQHVHKATDQQPDTTT
jgi:hypothetical protein